MLLLIKQKEEIKGSVMIGPVTRTENNGQTRQQNNRQNNGLYRVNLSQCYYNSVDLRNKDQQVNDGSLGILSTFRTLSTFSNEKVVLPQYLNDFH